MNARDHRRVTDEGAVDEWVAEFHGIVHPAGSGWGLDEPQELVFPDGRWVVIVQRSQFRVIVRGQAPSDLSTFRNEVISVVRGLLDSLGFHLGVALTPEFQGGFASPGIVILPSPGWPALTGRDPGTTLRASAEELTPFVKAAILEPLIRYALADLAMAIDRHEDTAFYAHRAVESARQYFRELDDPADKEVPWSRLRVALGFNEDDLKPLSKASRARRHGATSAMSEAERLEALRLGRDVIARLVKHHLQSTSRTVGDGAGPAS